jgi:hypothetical protein
MMGSKSLLPDDMLHNLGVLFFNTDRRTIIMHDMLREAVSNEVKIIGLAEVSKDLEYTTYRIRMGNGAPLSWCTIP